MFSFLKQLFKLQFFIIILAIGTGIFYPQLFQQIQEFLLSFKNSIPKVLNSKHTSNSPTKTELIFTKESLAKYTGEEPDSSIYLGILGSVYDVSKGREHYGPGCTYSFFASKDASKHFITGEFENFSETESDNVLTLEPKELLSLENWKSFYDKEYIYKGKLIGRFYDKNGAKTTYHYKFDALVQQAKDMKMEEEKFKSIYPPCNIEWAAETGTKVWCTKESGGNDRKWVGFPRKLFEPGQTSYRCACVQENNLDSALLKPYDDCDLNSDTCFYNVD